MDYVPDSGLDEKIKHISSVLQLSHVNLERVRCVKSFGSSSRRTLARIHTLSKIFQKTLSAEPFYIIEVISENFEKLDEAEKTRTLIHELLHIPKGFGGGFRHHSHVNRRSVEKAYKKYLQSDKKPFFSFFSR